MGPYKNTRIWRSKLRSNGCTRNLLFYFRIKFEKVVFQNKSSICRRSSVGILLSSRSSNLADNASRPSTCGILAYKPTISVVTNIAFSGNLPSSSSFPKKSMVSFMHDLADCVVGFRNLNLKFRNSEIHMYIYIYIYIYINTKRALRAAYLI